MQRTQGLQMDKSPRMGSDDPICDVCKTQGRQELANLVFQIAEKGMRWPKEWFGCVSSTVKKVC